MIAGMMPRLLTHLLTGLALVFVGVTAAAQTAPAPGPKDFYNQIKAFSLSGGSANVKGLTLRRDRAVMIFDGTFYFATPIEGHVTGAVFVGNGKFTAEVPPGEFEIQNVRRLLHADIVEGEFSNAVFRFSDDTFETLGQTLVAGATDAHAQKLASEIEARILKETGANLAARIALSLLNQEKPGFFFATFDGGKHRFSYLLDHQTRIPVAHFSLNAGEKGLIFSYDAYGGGNEVWMAFPSQADYQRNMATYSDLNDLLDIEHYDLSIDLRDHKKAVVMSARMQAKPNFANLRAVSFQIGDDLSEYENMRLKKQMRLKEASVGGKELAFVQEDWEGGFTLFLPPDLDAAPRLEFDLLLQGDFMYDAESCDCHYPRSNESWYPHQGYLDRATFDLRFVHPKKLHIASSGERLSEEPIPEDKNLAVTKFRMTHPVSLITFALGPFERHRQMVKWEQGGVGDPIPVEFSSLPGSLMAIKEDFILSELDNSLRYFTSLFGRYPYPIFGAAYHPFNFGQGFPTLLMIPATDRASKYTYVFIAHETSHQWWGDMVLWRSYRDQWLSEGFAEYSGVLYTGLRAGAGARDDLIGDLRVSLRNPPHTLTGVGKGRLVDVGPIILGHRLSTTKTLGAYQTLIYNKGALVLRMLHFLLTDPSSGQGEPFFVMMTDFVNRYRDKFASTDDFRKVANEHFAKSPVGRKYHLDNLDWFFRQWVYQTDLPSYQLEYQVTDKPNGKVQLAGTVTQLNAPNDWFMPLPLVISFGGKQEARGVVHAYGPSTPFVIELPMRPVKVELDPEHWVLSEKTSTKH